MNNNDLDNQTVDWEAAKEFFKKYQEQHFPQPAGLNPPTCSNCGYCPHCGRSNYPRPYISW